MVSPVEVTEKLKRCCCCLNRTFSTISRTLVLPVVTLEQLGLSSLCMGEVPRDGDECLLFDARHCVTDQQLRIFLSLYCMWVEEDALL